MGWVSSIPNINFHSFVQNVFFAKLREKPRSQRKHHRSCLNATQFFQKAMPLFCCTLNFSCKSSRSHLLPTNNDRSHAIYRRKPEEHGTGKRRHSINKKRPKWLSRLAQQLFSDERRRWGQLNSQSPGPILFPNADASHLHPQVEKIAKPHPSEGDIKLKLLSQYPRCIQCHAPWLKNRVA